DLRYRASMLENMATLDLRAGRFDDAAAHLRESLQIAARTGGQLAVLNILDLTGHLCAATGRAADAVTTWAASAARARREGPPEPPADARRRHEPLSQARQALGDVQVGAAEDRGAAMSVAAAAEYALTLTAQGPRPSQPPGPVRLSA